MGFDMDILGPLAYVPLVLASVIAIISSSHIWWCGYRKLSASIASWFIAAVFIARGDYFIISDPDHFQPSDHGLSFALFVCSPFLFFYLLWESGPKEYLARAAPSWGLIAINMFRMSGGLFFYVYYIGDHTDYVTLQSGVLDLSMAITALPLALLVRSRGLQKCKSIVIAWNLIGTYDLFFALSGYMLNLYNIYNPDKDLSYIGLYPFSLIALFQVPLFTMVHVTFLIYINEMTTEGIRSTEYVPIDDIQA